MRGRTRSLERNSVQRVSQTHAHDQTEDDNLCYQRKFKVGAHQVFSFFITTQKVILRIFTHCDEKISRHL